MKSTKIISLLLVLVMCFGILASCKPKDEHTEHSYVAGKCTVCGAVDPNYVSTYTYNTYVTISPSNWNELTYQDNNDTEVMGWIGSSFFTYDFKYDENGKIVSGEYDVEYSAATKLEDVSADVDKKWNIPEGGKGYAWKITLREDLKWQNGDPIKAEDFVYTMSEQLNPLFQNYRADSFYTGSTILVNAQNYVKQGQSGWFGADEIYDLSEYSANLDSVIKWKMGPSTDDSKAISYIRKYFESDSVGMPADYSIEKTASFIVNNMVSFDENLTDEEYEAAFAAACATLVSMEGKTYAEIKADDKMNAIYTDVLGWWKTEPGEELHLGIAEYTYPAVNFADVGIYAASDYEIVIVLAKPLQLLKEDGSLDYKAAYNMSSLPLVHKATYEANKVAPAEGSDLWTSKYNSSVETTMSWGPYKLTSFQTGMQFTLDRNPNWYGYSMEANAGLYQTDKIVYDVVKDWNSAWLLFQAGKIDGIGIDVSIADEYKNSDQAFFTPSDFVGSLQLQSSVAALKSRESEGINKSILGYTDFRKALSLSIDRADYNAKCTTASKAGFGLFNSMHYYDVANGGVFRNTDEAKKVLCDIYAVDYTKYDSLDDAVNAITGYNLTEARALLTKAYNEALAAGDIKDTDKVVLTFGTGAVNDVVTRRFEYIKAAWANLAVGTPLEGRIELEIKDFSTKWANDFRAGAYDVCMGGWTGAAWDPGYFLLAYLSPDYMYSSAWNTSSVLMTFTMVGVKGEDGKDITETMSLLDWYGCLNGSSDAKYNWSSGKLDESLRLQLIAALEKEVLKVYYTVPLQNEFSASLISYQIDYVTYDYNTFMGYGGVKYMTYNYDDAAWAAEVAKQGGQLNYK